MIEDIMKKNRKDEWGAKVSLPESPSEKAETSKLMRLSCQCFLPQDFTFRPVQLFDSIRVYGL